MKTEYRIYAAVALLVVLGAAVYFTRQSKRKDEAAHSTVAASADLPPIAVPKDDLDKITKVEIKNAEKTDVALEKKGDTWEVVKPVTAKANATNVKSLLDNLKELKVKEVIDRSANTYGQYDLADDLSLIHI